VKEKTFKKKLHESAQLLLFLLKVMDAQALRRNHITMITRAHCKDY